MRETVGWLISYNRAIWAAVLRPDRTFCAISARWMGVSFLRLPPTRRAARAAGRPALVRSRIMARSCLGKGANHVHHHATSRCGGVNRFRDTGKMSLCCINLLHNQQQILERAGEAIEFPDDDGVTLSQLLQHLMKLRTIPTTTRGGFRKDALDSSFLKSLLLERIALVITL